jgi:UDP-N-acetylmuramate--alanine ligase
VLIISQSLQTYISQQVNDMISQKCHFIGIGGIGMSGLARLLLKHGVEVSGSDAVDSYTTAALTSEGAKVYIGHAPGQVPAPSTVIYSTGILKDNPELCAAEELNCTLLHRSDLLAQLTAGYRTLAVAGTHGKTTTSALLSHLLYAAGSDPSFVIGGALQPLNTNARHGSSDLFVIEACESDGTFTKYAPFGGIITNIDGDHLDYFGSSSKLQHAFKTFASHVSSDELLFWCGDDSSLRELKLPGISYGYGDDCQLRIGNFKQEGWRIAFDVTWEGNCYRAIDVPLVGQHNSLNAAAVFGTALALGIPEGDIRTAMSTFGGVARRCERKGIVHGIEVIDDYAHHPTEVAATLNAIRLAIGERRLIAVYQPHRYTRIRDSFDAHAQAFVDADLTLITDIYRCGEKPIAGISAERLVEHVKLNALRTDVRYAAATSIVDELGDLLMPHDVVVFFGAGDITATSHRLVERLQKGAPKRLAIGLLFGGRSAEHEVSLMSARNVAEALKQPLYDIKFIALDKCGNWLTGEDAEGLLNGKKNGVEEGGVELSDHVLTELSSCDLLFPVLHGPFGEDGTIQGFFEMLGKPYVGCDHRSAALCMDKALTKQVMLQHDIPTVSFITLERCHWKGQRAKLLETIQHALPAPWFVKPAHLGSSVGVSKAETSEELAEAIDRALLYDYKLLVERAVNGRELEFALLGNESVTIFPPGEVFTAGKVYDYEGKYGQLAIAATAVATLTAEQAEEGRGLALRAYRAAGCTGLARVDFFLQDDGSFWLNEINPIPGFTRNSLYPAISAAHGQPLNELLERLIILALERHRYRR